LKGGRGEKAVDEKTLANLYPVNRVGGEKKVSI